MKKYVMICAAVAVAMSVASCKSSESAYKKAYEKAQAAEQAAKPVVQETVIQEVPVVQEPVVTPPPVVQQPASTPTPVASDNNVSERRENVTLVSGSGLKAYSVVVGSFGVRANAERLVNELKSKGYDAQIASSGTLYRVVATSFDDRNSAVNSRNSLIGSYPGAWLLRKN